MNGSTRVSVLLATDFEDGTHAALRRAAAITRALEGRLVLFHALPGVTAPTLSPTPSPAGPHSDLRSAVLRELGERVDALVVDQSVLDVETRPDSVGDAIVDAARRHDAALVVLGPSRDEGLARWLGDPVSATVYRESDRPVLVVHADDAAPGPEPISSMLLVRNASESAQPLLDAALALFPPGGPMRVVVLDVVAEGDDEPGSERLRGPDGLEASFQAVRGDPSACIVACARAEKVELVVMRPEPGSWLDWLRPTDTEETAADAPCPVLLVPHAREEP